MKLYADYEFCLQECNCDITEEVFSKHIREATLYLKRLTLGKSETYTGEELKYAACAVVEAYQNIETEFPGGKIVASENNDGFSQSFVTTGRSYEQVRNDKAYRAAKLWLSGTGLLSRRCVCR